MQEKIFKRLAKELSIPETEIVQTANLLDEGNTIPFIARYRKEMTGGLSDEDVRLLHDKPGQYGALN